MSFLIENDVFSLCLGENGAAESLRLKQSGEELLAANSEIPFFLATQERPYNNEIKLIHLNKETEFLANRVSMEDGELTHLELLPIELGFGEPRYRLGNPKVRTDCNIIERLAEMSADYGTKIRIDERGFGIVDLESTVRTEEIL